MSQTVSFDYFYGGQSDAFSYYRIPRLLVTGEQFKGLSTDAKLLYGLLLDRMGLSSRNGWYDDLGRVYIYYPVEEIEGALNCSHSKAVRLFAELDAAKGIGLIERVRQGLGKPSMIYVKQFTSTAVPKPPKPPVNEPPASGIKMNRQEVSNENPQKYQNHTFECNKIGSLKVSKSDGNYNNIINPYRNYLDLSINQSCKTGIEHTERRDIREALKANIGYPSLATKYGREDVNELLELVTDVICSTRPTIRIGSEEVPAKAVKDRFWRLDQSAVEYVFERMGENTQKIYNIRGYLLTVLYNAPTTIGHYYQAAALYDLYGRQRE